MMDGCNTLDIDSVARSIKHRLEKETSVEVRFNITDHVVIDIRATYWSFIRKSDRKPVDCCGFSVQILHDWYGGVIRSLPIELDFDIAPYTTCNIACALHVAVSTLFPAYYQHLTVDNQLKIDRSIWLELIACPDELRSMWRRLGVTRKVLGSVNSDSLECRIRREREAESTLIGPQGLILCSSCRSDIAKLTGDKDEAFQW